MKKIKKQYRLFFLWSLSLIATLANAQTTNPEIPKDSPLTHLRIYGGGTFELVSSAGKFNNAYLYGKARLLIRDWVTFDATAFYNPGGITPVQSYKPATYYLAHLTIGKKMGFTGGIEWGDRYYTAPKDSNAYHINYYNFTDNNTGEKKYFKSAQIKETMTTYCFGVSFMTLQRRESFWRAKGNPLSIIDFTIETLYAPVISYNHQFAESPYGVWAPEMYTVGDLNVKHWGFRLLAECGGSAKLSFHQEVGIRPGISDMGSHAKGQMKSRIYISMGASFCLDADGAKYKTWRANRDKPYID